MYNVISCTLFLGGKNMSISMSTESAHTRTGAQAASATRSQLQNRSYCSRVWSWLSSAPTPSSLSATILNVARTHGKTTVAEIQRLNPCSNRDTIKSACQDLITQGKLTKSGHGRDTYYT